MTTSATAQNTRAGIWLMIATSVVFASQDGISRHLAENYSVMMVVMIRFWVFALFVLALAARAPGASVPPAAAPCPGCNWSAT